MPSAKSDLQSRRSFLKTVGGAIGLEMVLQACGDSARKENGRDANWNAYVDPIPLPDLTLIDQFGKEFRLKDHPNKTILLDTGFTTCGPICLPKTFPQVKGVLADNPDPDFLAVTVTVLPSRDTQEVRKAFHESQFLPEGKKTPDPRWKVCELKNPDDLPVLIDILSKGMKLPSENEIADGTNKTAAHPGGQYLVRNNRLLGQVDNRLKNEEAIKAIDYGIAQVKKFASKGSRQID